MGTISTLLFNHYKDRGPPPAELFPAEPITLSDAQWLVVHAFYATDTSDYIALHFEELESKHDYR